MTISINGTSRSSANYNVIAPISMACALIGTIISSFVLILVFFKRQLHTVNYLMMCNTCLSSILYCVVQCTNYMYLLLITWDKSDQSCRWRGYFGYMSIAAVIYSYALQAISRFIFIILSRNYRWLTSFKIHFCMISIGWIIVLAVPLPSIVTKDIYFREGFLCWIPKQFMTHVIYNIISIYIIPICYIIVIYVYIYMKISVNTQHTSRQVHRKINRDMVIFRGIIILFTIYIIGAVPSIFYMLTGIEVFYSIGIVSVTLTVDVEKLASLFLDREIRNIIQTFVSKRTTVVPMAGRNLNVVL